MKDLSPQVSSTVAASIISLLIGGVIGFYIQSYLPKPPEKQAPQPIGGSAGGPMMGRAPLGMAGAPPAGMMGGAPAGMMGGMPGGGVPGRGGGFGGFGPSPSRDLTRLVRNLATIEKVQGQAITHEQAAQLAPLLKSIQNADTVSDGDATKDKEAIDHILTFGQKDALSAMNPQRGAGGFSPPAPGKPFASDQNKTALQSLIDDTGKL